VLVRRQGQGFTVELNPATLPRLLVNRRYHAELKAGATDKKSRAWLSEQLQSASWLVRRRSTSERERSSRSCPKS
jgi:RNA polymerase sigma-54 factor